MYSAISLAVFSTSVTEITSVGVCMLSNGIEISAVGIPDLVIDITSAFVPVVPPQTSH